MVHRFPPEVDEIVRRQMATGHFESEDQLLLCALRSLESEQEEWLAIKEGLDTLDRGEEGISLNEAFEAVRAKYDIARDA